MCRQSQTCAKWGQSHGALASDSARYSPHLGGTALVFAIMSRVVVRSRAAGHKARRSIARSRAQILMKVLPLALQMGHWSGAESYTVLPQTGQT